MSRFITAIAIASGLVMATHAQETTVKEKVKSSGGDVKTVTYTGCVQTGTQTRSFILNKAVPVSRTTTTREETGTAGTSTTTTTTYMLVPGEKVEIQEHVGHKVEVTGMLIPAGEVKSETRTKVEREGVDDTKTTARVTTQNSVPEFRVMSIKNLAESCQ